MLKRSLLTLTAAVPRLFPAVRADAAQLKLLVGGAMAGPVKKVGTDYSRNTSNTLDYMVNTTGALQGKLRAGEKAAFLKDMKATAGQAAIREAGLEPIR